MKEWRAVTLGDVIALQRGYDLPERKRAPGNVPVYGSFGITGYHDTAKAPGPGVLIGRSGASFGVVNYAPTAFWPHNAVLWVTDFKGNDPRFVSYLLKSMDFSNLNSGSAQPSLNRNYLYPLPVRVPDVDVQYRIASVLSAYDDLIENNTRRIKILKEMAQMIYREWFVNFRFPGHETVKVVESELGMIPKGWAVKKLFDVAEVTYGFPFKSKLFTEKPIGLPVIRIRDIRDSKSGTFTSESVDGKYIVKNGDLLVGMDGDFHMGKWSGGEAYLNQRVVRFRPKADLPSYFLFLALQAPIMHFDSTIVGTTVAHLSDRDLRSVSIVTPDEGTMEHAKSLFNTCFDLEISLAVKNNNLHRTRDLLLPKLISGEVRVEQFEAEAVAQGV